MNKTIVLIAVLALIIGFFAGYMSGSYVTIKAVANIASGFIEPQLVEQAIYQYNNHIGNCYPSQFEDAFNISDTRE